MHIILANAFVVRT